MNGFFLNVIFTYNGTLFSLEKEMLAHATTEMDLEGFMLSEINHTQKDKYCITQFI